MSRKERKAYNQGKKDGYALGYAQGRIDGNPFNVFANSLAEAINKVCRTLSISLSDPETAEAIVNKWLEENHQNPAASVESPELPVRFEEKNHEES